MTNNPTNQEIEELVNEFIAYANNSTTEGRSVRLEKAGALLSRAIGVLSALKTEGTPSPNDSPGTVGWWVVCQMRLEKLEHRIRRLEQSSVRIAGGPQVENDLLTLNDRRWELVYALRTEFERTNSQHRLALLYVLLDGLTEQELRVLSDSIATHMAEWAKFPKPRV